MSKSPPDPGGDPTGELPERPPTSPRDARPPLNLVVVGRDDGPDRATIHPHGLTGLARMETWLSTDRSVVVDLRAWR